MCTFKAVPQAELITFEQECCKSCGSLLEPRTQDEYLYHDEDLTGQAFDPIWIGEVQDQTNPWYSCNCQDIYMTDDDDLPF